MNLLAFLLLRLAVLQIMLCLACLTLTLQGTAKIPPCLSFIPHGFKQVPLCLRTPSMKTKL